MPRVISMGITGEPRAGNMSRDVPSTRAFFVREMQHSYVAIETAGVSRGPNQPGELPRGR